MNDKAKALHDDFDAQDYDELRRLVDIAFAKELFEEAAPTSRGLSNRPTTRMVYLRVLKDKLIRAKNGLPDVQ
jgi:hypothetical protein